MPKITTKFIDDIKKIRPGTLLMAVPESGEYIIGTKVKSKEESLVCQSNQPGPFMRIPSNSILLVLTSPRLIYKNDVFPWKVHVLWNSFVVSVNFRQGDTELRQVITEKKKGKGATTKNG